LAKARDRQIERKTERMRSIMRFTREINAKRRIRKTNSMKRSTLSCRTITVPVT